MLLTCPVCLWSKVSFTGQEGDSLLYAKILKKCFQNVICYLAFVKLGSTAFMWAAHCVASCIDVASLKRAVALHFDYRFMPTRLTVMSEVWIGPEARMRFSRS